MPSTFQSLNKKFAEQELGRALDESPLRFKVSFVADAIVPNNQEAYQSEIVKHAYEADLLPGGITAFIRGRMEESLRTNRALSEAAHTRFVSMDLKDVDLKILDGNFYSGKYGRYYARIEAQARVSGADGTVYLNAPVKGEFQGNRQSFSGGGLSVKQDWHNMQLAFLHAIDLLVLDITQKLTQNEPKNTLNLKGEGRYIHKFKQNSDVFAP